MERILEALEEDKVEEDAESSQKKSNSDGNGKEQNLPPSVFNLEKPAGGFSSNFPKMQEEKKLGRSLLNNMKENKQTFSKDGVVYIRQSNDTTPSKHFLKLIGKDIYCFTESEDGAFDDYDDSLVFMFSLVGCFVKTVDQPDLILGRTYHSVAIKLSQLYKRTLYFSTL